MRGPSWTPITPLTGSFFHAYPHPKAEVINDLSGDVAGLYRVPQRHYVTLMDMLRWQITSREAFERLLATDPETLTDLERAARFLYLQKTAFGSKVTGRNFGVSARDHNPGRFDVTKLAPELDAVHQRLAGVIVERLPWAKFIARYDTPDTLFYLDPPYWGSEHAYGRTLFDRSQFTELAAALATIQGRFILSINDTPEIRAIFQAFALEEAKHHFGLSAGPQTPARELILSGP